MEHAVAVHWCHCAEQSSTGMITGEGKDPTEECECECDSAGCKGKQQANNPVRGVGSDGGHSGICMADGDRYPKIPVYSMLDRRMYPGTKLSTGSTYRYVS